MDKDLISRQAAIDELKKYIAVNRNPNHDARIWEEGMNCAVTVIGALPSVHPDFDAYCDRLWKLAYERGKRDAQPQRWIPVSEALPDRYIVGGDGKHYSLDVLMTVIYRDEDIFIDYGQMVDDEWYSEMDKEIITSPFEVVAWMHLPKPYRGGQDETRGVSETP